MLKNLLVFFGLGFVWLFIFSIPIGHSKKTIFQIAHFYIVDTKLVHSITNLVTSTAHKTGDTATGVVDDVVHKIDENVPK